MPRKSVLVSENDELKSQVEKLKEENLNLKSRMELLDSEKTWLHKQIETLQEALVAKTSPDAYMEMRAARAAAEETPTTAEEMKEYFKEMELLKEYSIEVEKPTFNTDGDILEQLWEMAGVPDVAGHSIHNNNES